MGGTNLIGCCIVVVYDHGTLVGCLVFGVVFCGLGWLLINCLRLVEISLFGWFG